MGNVDGKTADCLEERQTKSLVVQHLSVNRRGWQCNRSAMLNSFCKFLLDLWPAFKNTSSSFNNACMQLGKKEFSFLFFSSDSCCLCHWIIDCYSTFWALLKRYKWKHTKKKKKITKKAFKHFSCSNFVWQVHTARDDTPRLQSTFHLFLHFTQKWNQARFTLIKQKAAAAQRATK